jgi:hypothetical protein
MSPYINTPNKAIIRRDWDHPILTGWSRELGHGLTYFGLPGPEVHDFIDWRDVLDPVRTGIEELGRSKKKREESLEKIAMLLLNVERLGMSAGFQLLRGTVEDVLLDGVDADGVSPRLNDGAGAARRRFLYDLVNLDFDGRFGYQNKYGAARRVSAIRRLFDRQQGHSFVLLLTINVRDTIGDEIEEYLLGLSSRERGSGWREAIEWYQNRRVGEREYKLKATIPSFVHAIAEGRMFRVHTFPPVVYEGYRSRMVHFVFKLESCEGNLRAFSDQDEIDLLSLPLIRAEDGRLGLSPLQPPGIDLADMEILLGFLSESTRSDIFGTECTISLNR